MPAVRRSLTEVDVVMSWTIDRLGRDLPRVNSGQINYRLSTTK
jgi:hypothetical protein